MAVFGVQVVLTMVVASFLHKLCPRYYSFGRWFVTRGLKYYTFISSQENASEGNDKSDYRASNTAQSQGTKNRKSNRGSNQRVAAKKEAVVFVKECTVTDKDLVSMHFSEELKWLLDLTLATVTIFCGTAVYFYCYPMSLKHQINLSTVWIAFVVLHTTVVLFRLTQIYLDPNLPTERLSQIILTLVMVVCLIFVLVVESSVFDFELTEDLNRLNTMLVMRFNLTTDASKRSIIPMWCFKGFIGVVASILAAILVFPTLNFARIHFESLKTSKSFAMKSFQNVSFVLPLLCGSLWIKANTIGRQDTPQQLAAYNRLGVYKTVLVLLLCVSRGVLFRRMMQVYLDRAKEQATRKNTETDTRVKHKMTSIFVFYCCTAIQYIGPVILLLMSSFLYVISSRYLNLFDTTVTAVDSGEVASLFTARVFEGTFSFMTWWLCFCMFMLASLGSIIHAYFQP